MSCLDKGPPLLSFIAFVSAAFIVTPLVWIRESVRLVRNADLRGRPIRERSLSDRKRNLSEWSIIANVRLERQADYSGRHILVYVIQCWGMGEVRFSGERAQRVSIVTTGSIVRPAAGR